ncbi:hypothetical protein HNV11_06780 [Spirosoma taeanense]|uniref:Uncharacterized protein n=1 Tax=Spirosoma taeanense TaxID=2735870 RepID=A0A6M5Y5N7_9BACT|nr:hypothetical protein [Spirosoma taeanense]QJW89115.1 hypothetical protein HNV11_06780 [Spirosoma taeanense]
MVFTSLLRLPVLRIALTILLLWPHFSNGQPDFRIPYKRSPLISSEAGKPVNAATWYFPAERFIDSTYQMERVPKERITPSMRTDPKYTVMFDTLILERRIQTRVDTFRLKWFSYYLFRLGEPVLSNYPLPKEVYRLTWIRSFHPPVVVRLEKEGNKVQLITKVLSRIPELPGHRYMDQAGNLHITDTSVTIPFRIDSRRPVSLNTFNRFRQLLQEQNALAISPLGFRNSFGTDGSEWILETHRPDGYYFVVRWTPEPTDPLRVLGDYLLNLSDAKDEKRY